MNDAVLLRERAGRSRVVRCGRRCLVCGGANMRLRLRLMNRMPPPEPPPAAKPNVVHAVVVKRFAGECAECEAPLMVLNDDMQLGDVVPVDLATRRSVRINLGHGTPFTGDLVELAQRRGTWAPVEVFLYEGREL